MSEVKFYQVGSRAVGNRLLDPALRSEQSRDQRHNSLTSGHRACQGCGEALAARYVLDAAERACDGQLVVVNATGCLEVFTTPSPDNAWQLPWMHSLFANAASVATGVTRALRASGRSHIRVLAQGGDGGTADIGLACLSGMFERSEDVLYVCYDNEAYMNTGVQRSGTTPPGARTATTEPVGGHPGAPFGAGKNMPSIALAHDIGYVATASIAHLHDLEAKVAHAMSLRGARYLHVLVPCPLGWGSAPAQTVEIARLAQRSGLFPVFEAIDGRVSSVEPIRSPVPVEDYLRLQGRYAHLFRSPGRPDIVSAIQAIADRNIAEYGLLSGGD